ncbi:MAG: hypothetical protein IT428_01405 [Planctomycetaceae bacterium]|nr:hypothetical protein [Planctomycetaceae bacterium]
MRYLSRFLLLMSAASIAFVVGWLGQWDASERGPALDAWAMFIISVGLGTGIIIRSVFLRMRETPLP